MRWEFLINGVIEMTSDTIGGSHGALGRFRLESYDTFPPLQAPETYNLSGILADQCSPRWEQRDNSESDTWQAARFRRMFPPVTAPRRETTRATAIRAREPAGSSAIPRMTCHRCTG